MFKIKYVTLLWYCFFLVQYCNKNLFTRKKLSLFRTGYNVYNYHIIVTIKIDSVQITSVRKAGLTIYESF